jgi:hypothetical protein
MRFNDISENSSDETQTKDYDNWRANALYGVGLATNKYRTKGIRMT